jgi:serine/threonine-protein kinase RsbT
MDDDTSLPIRTEHDILIARQRIRELAAEVGFTGSDLTILATAVSEIARNIVQYAQRGEIVFTIVREGKSSGIVVVARDEGPGIPDVELAMRDGYSTRRSLGLGLPGARRLMDEFELDSGPGTGTTVTMKKWIQNSAVNARR